MRLKVIYVPIIVVLILFIGIGVADAAGMWKIESDKTPVTIKEGEFSGMPDPVDIKGSYSFGDIEAAFNVEVSVLADAFGITTETPEDFKCKDLETAYADMSLSLELGTGSVKEFVALYTGLPYEGEDAFPSFAVEVLKRDGQWSEDMAASLEGRIVQLGQKEDSLSPITTEASEAETAMTTEEVHDESIGVKGKTTVAEIIAWGLTVEEIEQVLTIPIEDENLTIRDICTNNGLTFSEVKAQLNVLLTEE